MHTLEEHSSSIAEAMRRRTGADSLPATARQNQETLASPTDRRRYPRRSSVCSVRVVRTATTEQRLLNPLWAFRSTTARGKLLDISMSGVAFSASEAFNDGESVLLEVSHPHRGHSIVRGAQVISCDAVGPQEHRLVCEFGQRLSFEEVTLVGHRT